MDTIGLYFNAYGRKDRGAFKVAENLMKGLTAIGQKYKINERCEYNGVLQGGGELWTNRESGKILWGPTLVVMPYEASWCFDKNRSHVVPCQWVKNHYMLDKTCYAKLHVWPVGIDTDYFNHRKCNKLYDCLLYFKNATFQRDEKEINLFLKILEQHKQTYQIIKYGNYDETQYMQWLDQCRYMVVIAGTESQFIALQEAHSMNVPTYIFDETTMKYKNVSYKGLCFTTAPYFDERCGIVAENAERFPEFLKQLHNYCPREYILENLTLEKCAAEYMKIMEMV